MKLYKYNFFADYRIQSGEVWANSKFDVESKIKIAFPKSTEIHIWSA